MNKELKFWSNLNLPNEISKCELFFVGGAVRSILAGNALPKDIDLCGNISVEDLYPLDLQDKQFIKKLHSIRFKNKNHDIDLTAFRKEEYKKGYFPSKVERVETAFEDSFRRDFTINAIYISKGGEILDFHRGEEHIKNKIISQITEKTLEVDGMRIYRMIRFALTLGYEIDKHTIDCAYQNAKNIYQIKKERAQIEFDKFKSQITNENIEMIDKLGIFDHLEISKHKFENT